MKIFRSVIFICVFFFWVIPACMKNTVTVDYAGPQKAPGIVLPKDTVKKGEPFFVSAPVQDSNTIIKWAISPSLGTVIVPFGNKATINISLSGSYLITANFYTPANTVTAYDSLHSTIIVNDSVYVPPASGLDSVALFGDGLRLTPVFSAVSGFKFILATSRVYSCYPFLANYEVVTSAPGSSPINMNFDGALVVQTQGGCQGLRNQVFLDIPIAPLDIGVHTIAINFNNKKFEGSVNVTDSNFTFTWTDNVEVVLSPLQIKKK